MAMVAIRAPLSGSGDWKTRKKYPVYVAGTVDGWVEFGFRTNPNGEKQSTFDVRIGRESFAELAQAMMNANPHEAIKAFGLAMQQIPEIPRPSVEE
jgi:hypothetical protein